MTSAREFSAVRPVPVTQPTPWGSAAEGPHFCLGSQQAKAELRILFGELLTRLTTIEFGEPDRHGAKRLPAVVR
ncbi:hypothetical protein AU193_13330 [Mycobacterium sp. GA-1285]|nr:hypothetical protein [Mycobacterium sp. GA-1285]KUI19609.1 hypothetical protein AU193_13330 [Mycobacterium sp. GA-1285]